MFFKLYQEVSQLPVVGAVRAVAVFTGTELASPPKAQKMI